MKQQNGFATLLVSVVLVLIVTVSVFFGQKASVLEQQVANNTYWSEQAFENAESGLVAYMQAVNAELAKSANKNIKQFSESLLNTAKGSAVVGDYALSFDNLTATRVRLISTGTTPMSSATRRSVAAWMEFNPAGKVGPGALNARGNIDLDGNAKAESIVSGGTVDKGHSADDISVSENSKQFMVSYIGSSGTKVYRMMTSGEFFLYYFSSLCPISKANYDQKVAEGKISESVQAAAQCKVEAKNWVSSSDQGYVCASDCGSKTETDKIEAAYSAGKRWFWLDSGGMDHKINMGTEADPVVIFVMGIQSGSTAAKINANSTIYGVLYVDVISGEVDCFCEADAQVVSVLATSKRHFKEVTSGGTQCSAKSGCPDEDGHVINWKKRYVEESVTVNTPVWGGFSTPSLKGTNDSVCTATACANDLATASKSCTGGSAIGDSGTCEYISVAVTGAADQPVQLEIIGTWEGSGTGNTVVKGATITSGNYTGQGNVLFSENVAVINKILELGLGGAGFEPKRLLFVHGWQDI